MAEIPNRSPLEASFAAKLAKLGADERKKLERLLGTPPNVKNVPADFWKKAQAEMEKKLAAALLILFTSSSRVHGLPEDDIEEQAEAYASRQAQLIATGFIDHSQQLLDNSVGEWEEELNKTGKVRKSSIRTRTIMIWGPKRMSRVAITETTGAIHTAAEEAIAATVGLSDEDIWHTSEMENVCTKCKPLNNKPRRVWAIDYPLGPPSPHPECNCWIEYVNQLLQESIMEGRGNPNHDARGRFASGSSGAGSSTPDANNATC